jgi:hypothetical protein
MSIFARTPVLPGGALSFHNTVMHLKSQDKFLFRDKAFGKGIGSHVFVFKMHA